VADRKILTPDQEAAITTRRPFKPTMGNPWLIGYRTKGGYIIANDGSQNDDERPHDLLYLHDGGGVARLTPMVNPDLVEEILALVEGSLLA
jgi:hypothetical protein